MLVYAKPKVVVSKCLGFAACRWNGAVINDEFVKNLGKWVDYLPICPEAEIGLGVPRDPVRLVRSESGARLMQPATGIDCTGAMERFLRGYLGSLNEVEGFMLKSRSPTCGPMDVKIYAGMDKGSSSTKGRGLFAAAAVERFPLAAMEHEGRVKNFHIREHFLTKLFTLAGFREVKKQMTVKTLIDFHSANKYLLMAYNQTGLRLLGKIVANPKKRPITDVLEGYEKGLQTALNRGPKYTSNINVLMHCLGYFKDKLKPAEKAHFLDLMEDYRAGRLLLSALLALLRSWVLRFEDEYLAGQSFFAPYPTALVDISDSGKGRALE